MKYLADTARQLNLEEAAIRKYIAWLEESRDLERRFRALGWSSLPAALSRALEATPPIPIQPPPTEQAEIEKALEEHHG